MVTLAWSLEASAVLVREAPPLGEGLSRGDKVTGGQQGEDLQHNLTRQNEDTWHFDRGTQGSNFHKKF